MDWRQHLAELRKIFADGKVSPDEIPELTDAIVGLLTDIGEIVKAWFERQQQAKL